MLPRVCLNEKVEMRWHRFELLPLHATLTSIASANARMYWTFGYGSLMWDGWEEAYGGTRHEGAVLDSYARAMNKASLKNWGSSTQPGPTMGLERVEGATCVGVAFAVPDHQEEAVRSYLRGVKGRASTS